MSKKLFLKKSKIHFFQTKPILFGVIISAFIMQDIYFLPISHAHTNKSVPIHNKKPQYISGEKHLLSEGEKYYLSNKFEKALEYFNRANKINPNNHVALFGISKCYFALMDLKNAYKYINIAICKSPGNVMYFTFAYEIKNCLEEEVNSGAKTARIVENGSIEKGVGKDLNDNKTNYKVNPENIIIELNINDLLSMDFEAYINSDCSISLPFKTTAKLLEIQTDQNHFDNSVTFMSPSGISGKVDYKNQQITFGTKVFKFEPNSAQKIVFLNEGLSENIKDEVFIPIKYMSEILETDIKTDMLNYSVTVKTPKTLSALIQYYTMDENLEDPFGAFVTPDDTYKKVIFPEKSPKFSLNTIQVTSDSQFYSDRYIDKNSVYKYLFRNNISKSEFGGIILGGNYKIALDSQVFGQNFFTFGGMNIKYKKPCRNSFLELGNLSGIRLKRFTAAEDLIGIGLGNIKEKPDSYNDVYGIAGLGSKINVFLNDKPVSTINTKGGYYNLGDISYQNDKITKLRLEEITLEGTKKTIREEKYPVTGDMLVKGKTEYSVFSGLTGYQNQIFSNYYYSSDMNSKKLAGGVKLSRGLTDNLTVSILGVGDQIILKPKDADLFGMFPLNNTSSILYSIYKDFNYISGQTLLSSIDYALTKNLIFNSDFGISHAQKDEFNEENIHYKFKPIGYAADSYLNYEKENYSLSAGIYNYSPSFYLAGSSGIGGSTSMINDKIGGELGGRIGNRFVSLSGNISKYSTNLDNYYMDGKFDFDNYNYTVRVPLPGDSDINLRQSSKIGKNNFGDLINKSYEVSMRRKLSKNADFNLDGQILKFDSRYINDNYNSDMKFLSAKIRYDISESNKGTIELSHDIFKTGFNGNNNGYNAVRLNYILPEFKNILTSLGVGVHYTGTNKGFDLSASMGYKFNSGRRFMLTYNYNRFLGSMFDDIFIPQSTRHSFNLNLTDALMVNNEIKSIGYTSDNAGYIQTIAFLDINQNGNMDKNEPCIPEIAINFSNSKNLAYYTNKKGVYTSGGVPEGLYKVSLSYDDLPSNLAVSPASNEEVLVRVDKNKLSKVYFGLLSMIGAVSGKIIVTDEFDRTVPLKNLVLVLYNEKGEEVKYTTIGEDGNYYISGISPGKYTVNIDKDFQREYHLKPRYQGQKEIEIPLSYKENIELKDINLDYLQTYENSL